jgi:hypothetical protein
MMTSPATSKTTDLSPTRGWLHFIRPYLGNRWVLLLLGGLVLVIGLSLNWGWLVAVGAAPVILSLAPCAIMCAVGLCGMKMLGGAK